MRSTQYLQAALRLIFTLIALSGPIWAQKPTHFAKVETSSHAGSQEDLNRTIDGRNASPTGWNVGKNLERPQLAIFTASEPIEADLIDLSFFFMSGSPHKAFADFRVSYTTDATPSPDAKWSPIPLLNLSAITCKLTKGKDKHILAEETAPVVRGSFPDEIYRISTRLPGKSVTGFRIEVFPVLRRQHPADGPVMAWALSGEFVLTEFRAEVVSTSTNVALGATVSATHPLYGLMAANALTDGWPSTMAHPNPNAADEDFYFEIDLGQVRQLDHLNLRQRGDPSWLNRFSKMRIELYHDAPSQGARPSWQTLHRADGSFPDLGELDVLYPADGQGTFSGRYLRIHSENAVPGSPQLAEVEAYETRTPQLVSAYGDDQALSHAPSLRIPPGIQRLGFQFEIPQTGKPDKRLYRWKLQETNNKWQTAHSLLLEIPCPPAGSYQLLVQAAHSDGTWDATVLSLPFSVQAKFTQTRTFLWLVIAITLFFGVLTTRYFARRKISQLKAESALEAERSRIAANMHDDVGARLAQISILHEVFEMEHALSPAAKSDLALLKNSTREAMESLDEAVWTVNPRNDTVASLAAYLIHFAESYLCPLGIACQVQAPNAWPETKLLAGLRHEVALAFKEALQNVVKHAEASEVQLVLKIEGKRFIIQVSDNGQGFSLDSGAPGEDGLDNMRRRLESIRGSCVWLPIATGGTLVEMKFPLS